MEATTTSIPSRLTLLSEHTIVYAQPYIVATVDHRMKVYASKK